MANTQEDQVAASRLHSPSKIPAAHKPAKNAISPTRRPGSRRRNTASSLATPAESDARVRSADPGETDAGAVITAAEADLSAVASAKAEASARRASSIGTAALMIRP